MALEKWEDAPAYMERTVVQPHRATSAATTAAAAGEITVPEREFLSSRHEGEAEERLFVSRLRLRGPVSVPLHAGKYVVMTMSRSNLKVIDYAVAYVHIVPSKSLDYFIPWAPSQNSHLLLRKTTDLGNNLSILFFHHAFITQNGHNI